MTPRKLKALGASAVQLHHNGATYDKNGGQTVLTDLNPLCVLQLQDNIQSLVRHFFRTLEENPVWEEASDEGILKVPNMEDWENKSHVTHVVPIMTRQRYTVYLCWHLQLAGLNCFPIDYPVVPRGMNRLRVVFHAHNTEAEVEKLASCLCEWATEMMEIEESGDKGRLPGAARQVIDVKAAAR